MHVNKIALIISIIILLVLILLLHKSIEKPSTIKASTLVESQNIKDVKQVPKTKKTTQNKKTIPINDSNSNKEELAIDPELSYLAAFRQYTFFSMCEKIIDDLELNKNPLDSFTSDTEYRNKMFGYSGGKDHESYFLDHVENCKDLLKYDGEPFDQAYSRLKTTYQKIEPKTNEELELANSIALFENVEDLKTQLEQAITGISTLSQKANQLIILEIKNINNILAPLQSISIGERTIEQSNQITYYLNKRRALFKKSRDAVQKDEELIESLKQEYNDNLELLTDSITSIKSPDIYALMTRRGIYSYHMIEITTHSKDKTPFKDRYYPDVLTRTSLPLFACALGYPCAEDSQITLYHCIIMYNKNACGKSVEDFYFNHYVSPNMQPDLNIFINYLFEHYAID